VFPSGLSAARTHLPLGSFDLQPAALSSVATGVDLTRPSLHHPAQQRLSSWLQLGNARRVDCWLGSRAPDPLKRSVNSARSEREALGNSCQANHSATASRWRRSPSEDMGVDWVSFRTPEVVE